MTLDLINLQKCLQIDKNALDEALVGQPALFFQISEAFVEAMAIKDTKKEQLATVDAELDSMFRQSSNDKTTEAKIKNQIQLHPRHQIAFAEFNDAKLYADRLGVLKEAFHQRGYMIRDLCQLAVANFFEVSSVKETQSTQAVAYNSMRDKLAAKRSGHRVQP